MQSQTSPFHTGEQMIQLRAGVRDLVEQRSKEIHAGLTTDWSQALDSSRLAFAGFADAHGRLVCSPISGPAGFLRALEPTLLEFTGSGVGSGEAGQHLDAGSPLALVIPEILHGQTLRISGAVEAIEADRLRVRIAQAYCKGGAHMHLRDEVAEWPAPMQVAPSARGELDAEMAALLSHADTLVVTTCHPDLKSDGKHGLDVSLRCGLPGFVEAPDAATLLWPEYSDNNFFSTIGNLMLDSRCCVLASASGSEQALHIRGRAEVLWNDPELKTLFGGTGRGIRVRVECVAFVTNALEILLPLTHYAPDLAGTSRRTPTPPPWRPLRVIAKDHEAEGIISLELGPQGPEPLRPFLAGQHIAVQVPDAAGANCLERFYSLSRYEARPQRYRLTVKRAPTEAAQTASARLHEQIEVGSILSTSAPTGHFTLPSEPPRPLVFVSEGIGIAPQMAMLQALAEQHPGQALWFIHGTGNGESQLFKEELAALRDRLRGASWHIHYSEPLASDLLGRDFTAQGRITLDTLRSILPFDGFDFYLCGPDRFLAELNAGLRGLGVPAAQVHLESFGIQEDGARGPEMPLEAVLPVTRKVSFVRSGITAYWEGGDESLLELAHRAAIDAPFSCRTGMCGTCSQHLLSGRVAYQREVTARTGDGRVLLCSALPASDIELDL